MVAYGVNDHSILRIHGHPNNQTEDRIKYAESETYCLFSSATRQLVASYMSRSPS